MRRTPLTAMLTQRPSWRAPSRWRDAAAKAGSSTAETDDEQPDHDDHDAQAQPNRPTEPLPPFYERRAHPGLPGLGSEAA
jgi:hypothetical protein